MGKNTIHWVTILVAIWYYTSITNAEYLKYKDPKKPIGARVKDLLSRMTLEEKIGQMVQIERSVASQQVMKNYYIGNSLNYTSYLCEIADDINLLGQLKITFLLYYSSSCTVLR